MAGRFSGFVAWITGGGSGIGEGIALELASQGATVVVSGRRVERLNQVVSTIRANEGDARAICCDVTDCHQVNQTVAAIYGEMGRIDVVVANAGLSVTGPFENLTEKEWMLQINTNLLGVVWTLHESFPYLKKVGGRAAVVSSVAGKLAIPKSSAYCASKFALVGLCNALYQEWHGTSVSITNLLPGLVESEISQVGNDGVFRPESKKRSTWLEWSSAQAAKSMVSAIYKRKREAVITGHGKFAVFMGQHIGGMTYWATSRCTQSLK